MPFDESHRPPLGDIRQRLTSLPLTAEEGASHSPRPPNVGKIMVPRIFGHVHARRVMVAVGVAALGLFAYHPVDSVFAGGGVRGQHARGPREIPRHGVVQPDTITCSGYGCDNLDPVATGCYGSNTYVAASTGLYLNNGQNVGYVNNKYNPNCATNYAQVGLYGSNCGAECNLTAQTCRGSYCTDIYSSNTLQQIYSNQVYAPSPICATAIGFFDNGNYSGQDSVTAC